MRGLAQETFLFISPGLWPLLGIKATGKASGVLCLILRLRRWAGHIPHPNYSYSADLEPMFQVPFSPTSCHLEGLRTDSGTWFEVLM